MRGDNAPMAEIDALCAPHRDRFAEGLITVVDDSHGVGVIVIGWDYADSYAYTGGMGMAAINPDVD